MLYSDEEVLTQIDNYVILDRKCGIEPKIRLAVRGNQTYAAKTIEKWKLSELGRENLKRGMHIHTTLCSYSHPGIVKVYDVLEDEQCHYIIMEVMDGDLLTLLEKRSHRLAEEEAQMIFWKVVDVVEFIHAMGYCHKDLKPDNILFSWDEKEPDKVKSIKLTDFEFSDNNSKIFTKSCGSPAYAAPEICSYSPHRGDKIDVWCLGITLYVLLCGKFPWFSNDNYELFYMITENIVPIPEYLSADCQDLIQRLLTKDPAERISIREIKMHPWMRRPKYFYDSDDSRFSKSKLISPT